MLGDMGFVRTAYESVVAQMLTVKGNYRGHKSLDVFGEYFS